GVVVRALSLALAQRSRLGMIDGDSVVSRSHTPESACPRGAHRPLALGAARTSPAQPARQDRSVPLDAGTKMKLTLIAEGFHRAYHRDYSALPDSNQRLDEVLQRRYGNTMDWQWVAESGRAEPVASQYMIRGESFAYEGKLGLTGYYFGNGNLEGEPVVIRH